MLVAGGGRQGGTEETSQAPRLALGQPGGPTGVVMITFEPRAEPYPDEPSSPTLRLIEYLTGYSGRQW